MIGGVAASWQLACFLSFLKPYFRFFDGLGTYSFIPTQYSTTDVACTIWHGYKPLQYAV
jgi:hypothetical protein